MPLTTHHILPLRRSRGHEGLQDLFLACLNGENLAGGWFTLFNDYGWGVFEFLQYVIDEPSYDRCSEESAVLADYPDLDLGHEKYGYYEERRAWLNEYYAMALMSLLVFPFFKALKSRANPLTAEEVLKIGVNEDFYFWKLDSARVVFAMGPPITILTPHTP